MSGYFRYFPLISYNNTAVVDITRRDVVTTKSRRSRFAFHDYQILEGQRPDFVAEKYYGDPLDVWMVWFSGEVIDPYYDWYLSTEQFNSYITGKYGTLEKAMNSIAYWQLAWDSLTDTITSASDYAALPDPLRKYYNARFDVNGNIVSYRINRQDWRMSTNMTVTWPVNTPFEGNGFVKGETVNFKYNCTQVVGNSVVVFANTSTVVSQHVFGNTSPNTATEFMLIGLTTNTRAYLTADPTVVLNMPIDELVYFSAVSHYEDETMKNESKKFTRLLDSNYKSQAEQELFATLQT